MIDRERHAFIAWVILAHIAATSGSNYLSNEPLQKPKQNHLSELQDSNLPGLTSSSSCNQTSSGISPEIPLPLFAATKDPTAFQAALLRKVLGSKVEGAAKDLQANLVPCVKRPRRQPIKAKGEPLTRWMIYLLVLGLCILRGGAYPGDSLEYYPVFIYESGNSALPEAIIQ